MIRETWSLIARSHISVPSPIHRVPCPHVRVPIVVVLGIGLRFIDIGSSLASHYFSLCCYDKLLCLWGSRWGPSLLGVVVVVLFVSYYDHASLFPAADNDASDDGDEYKK